MSKSGVYKICNQVNGKIYIGSSVNITDRWSRHLRDLNKNSHHILPFQRAWNKYGKSAFKFEIIEMCDSSQLAKREEFFLSALNPDYNVRFGAYKRPSIPVSEERKSRMSEIAIEKGFKPPPETYEYKRRAVVMIDKVTGTELACFISISDACRHVGKSHLFVSMISDCCNGKRRKTAFGYAWKWIE